MGFITIDNVTKSYGAFRALDGVSLQVPRGSVYGLLGPNGAGKTTLIRIINQILSPDSGQVLIEGKPIRRDDVRRIGYLPEERGLYKKMRIGDQAIYLAQLKGLSRGQAVRALREWFERFGIESWWNRKVEDLSKGMAQKVQFIVTVLHRPSLLIFDEPFSGFDPINADILKTEILRLRDEGATILFSTHNMASVEEVCDHITLINRSRNVLTGAVNAVREQFSQPAFILRYRGAFDSLRQAIDPQWSMQELPEEKGCQRVRLDGQNAALSTNQLLQSIIQQVEVVDFTRLAATMNDIFIRVVQESNAMQN